MITHLVGAVQRLSETGQLLRTEYIYEDFCSKYTVGDVASSKNTLNNKQIMIHGNFSFKLLKIIYCDVYVIREQLLIYIGFTPIWLNLIHLLLSNECLGCVSTFFYLQLHINFIKNQNCSHMLKTYVVQDSSGARYGKFKKLTTHKEFPSICSLFSITTVILLS